MDPHTVSARLHFGGFHVDEADARLKCAYGPMPLAPKPFAVLCTLARSPQRLVTKDELLSVVGGHQFVANSVLKSAISEVWAALGDDPKQPRYIETISRRVYRFIATPLGMSSHAATVDQKRRPTTRSSVSSWSPSRLRSRPTKGSHSYRLGQIVTLRQDLGAWPRPSGGDTW